MYVGYSVAGWAEFLEVHRLSALGGDNASLNKWLDEGSYVRWNVKNDNIALSQICCSNSAIFVNTDKEKTIKEHLFNVMVRHKKD